MTYWAKVLTVIAFVLSLVFAGMSAIVYAKRGTYKQDLVLERDARKADQVKADGELKTLKGQLSDLDAALKLRDDEIGDKQKDIDNKQQTIDKLTADLADAKLTLSNEQSQVTSLTANNAALTKSNEEYVATISSLQTERNGLIDQLSKEQTLTRQLEAEKADLTKLRDSLQTELTKANATIDLNEEVFAELSKRNIEARTVLVDMQIMPAIDGLVTAVVPESHVVTLNVGAKDGVRKNFNFSIFRGEKFIAKVNVFNVEDKRCAAEITLSEGPVKVGDAALTRLHF